MEPVVGLMEMVEDVVTTSPSPSTVNFTAGVPAASAVVLMAYNDSEKQRKWSRGVVESWSGGVSLPSMKRVV
jgi:hypothetical protein